MAGGGRRPGRTGFVQKIVNPDVHTDALQHHTRSHACSSVKSVVPNACACHQVFMGTNTSVPATTTGRLRKANPSVPDFNQQITHNSITLTLAFQRFVFVFLSISKCTDN
ncbi:hypothetical protein R6Q59_013704 [Mikania micrantha]